MMFGKKEKIYDNTFIIIMADNGRPFPHSKTRLNDQGVKTPFILLYKNGNVSKMYPNSRKCIQNVSILFYTVEDLKYRFL